MLGRVMVEMAVYRFGGRNLFRRADRMGAMGAMAVRSSCAVMPMRIRFYPSIMSLTGKRNMRSMAWVQIVMVATAMIVSLRSHRVL